MPFSSEANITGPFGGYSDPNAVLYVLELRDRSKAVAGSNADFVGAMHLPLVQSISFQRQEATSFDWTLGRTPIREFSGLRESMITISGRSGISHRLGRNSNGQVLFASGVDLFQEMEKFLEEYQTDALERQNAKHEIFNSKELYLRCFFENKHFKVEPVSFSFNRSTGASRFSYEYQIQFRTYGPAQDPQFNFMAQMISQAEAATQLVDAATSYVAFTANIVNDFGASVQSFVEPVRAVSRLMNQVSAVSTATEAVARTPSDFAEAGFNAVNAGIDAVFDLSVAAVSLSFGLGSEAVKEIQKVQRKVLLQMGIARRATLRVLGAKFGRIAIDEEGFIPLSVSTHKTTTSALGLGPVKGVATFVLSAGQDLKSVAAAVFGDDSLWTILADMNGLTGVNQAPNGSPLFPGYVVVIPLFKDKGLPMPVGATELSPESIYGVDFKLTADGDLSHSETDLNLTRGIPLLRQALTVRLLTAKGENGVFPNYGLPNLVGEPTTGSTAGIISASVNAQVTSDPRIAEANKIVLQDLGNTVSVECLVSTVGGPDIPLAVAVER